MSGYYINVFYSNQDGGYTADIPDLKYCSALGETPEEALREAMLAKAAWLEAAPAKHEERHGLKPESPKFPPSKRCEART